MDKINIAVITYFLVLEGTGHIDFKRVAAFPAFKRMASEKSRYANQILKLIQLFCGLTAFLLLLHI